MYFQNDDDDDEFIYFGSHSSFSPDDSAGSGCASGFPLRCPLSCVYWHVFSTPFFFLSDSSEEESAGEREEEIGAGDEVTKTTEAPAEQTSNTQTGEVFTLSSSLPEL